MLQDTQIHTTALHSLRDSFAAQRPRQSGLFAGSPDIPCYYRIPPCRWVGAGEPNDACPKISSPWTASWHRAARYGDLVDVACENRRYGPRPAMLDQRHRRVDTTRCGPETANASTPTHDCILALADIEKACFSGDASPRAACKKGSPLSQLAPHDPGGCFGHRLWCCLAV